jgi:carboxylesterase type B
MFWIYGGVLQFGTAGQDIFDGSCFASNQDVVVVSANYRTNGKISSELVIRSCLQQ